VVRGRNVNVLVDVVVYVLVDVLVLVHVLVVVSMDVDGMPYPKSCKRSGLCAPLRPLRLCGD